MQKFTLSTLRVQDIDPLEQVWKDLDDDFKRKSYALVCVPFDSGACLTLYEINQMREKYPLLNDKSRYPGLWVLKTLLHNAYVNWRATEMRKKKNGGKLPAKKKTGETLTPSPSSSIEPQQKDKAEKKGKEGESDGKGVFSQGGLDYIDAPHDDCES